MQPVLEPPPKPGAEPSESEYAEFCATVMASARGRWFLAEYARRHRKADTAAVLAALHRIEDMVRAVPPAPPLARMRDELRALAAMVREARGDLETNNGQLSAASQTMALLDLLERQIDYALAPGDDRTPLPLPEPPMEAEAKPDTARVQLSIVAVTDQPMPAEPPAGFPSAALLPPLDPADAGPNLVMLARKNQSPPPNPAPLNTSPHKLFTVSEQTAPPATGETLASRFSDVMALSEEERIALFS